MFGFQIRCTWFISMSTKLLLVAAHVAMRVVASSDERSYPAMQPASAPSSEQLSAPAAGVSDVTGLSSPSAADPMSSRVTTMPHRLPAAMHAFRHTVRNGGSDSYQRIYSKRGTERVQALADISRSLLSQQRNPCTDYKSAQLWTTRRQSRHRNCD